MTRNPCNRRKGRRAGFTLMEILLVAMILVIMASMAIYGFTAIQKAAISKLTVSEINTIEGACTQFKITHLHFPNKLEELITPVQGMTKTQWGGAYLIVEDFNDPWGQPYKYTVDEVNERVLISSPGPDRQSGTEDDLSSTN